MEDTRDWFYALCCTAFSRKFKKIKVRVWRYYVINRICTIVQTYKRDKHDECYIKSDA